MLATCAIYCHLRVLVGKLSGSPSNVVGGVYLLSHARLNQSAYRDVRSGPSATPLSGPAWRSAEPTGGDLAWPPSRCRHPAGTRPGCCSAGTPGRRGGGSSPEKTSDTTPTKLIGRLVMIAWRHGMVEEVRGQGDPL